MHKLNNDASKWKQQLAEWDALHSAEMAELEIETRLNDLKLNAEAKPPEERKRKAQALVAEYKAFLEKHPDHRNAALDDFVKNPVLDVADASLGIAA